MQSYTPRLSITLSGLAPTIARHRITRAALTSLLRTPLFLHNAPITAITHTKNETSKNNRRTMIIVGERFSFLAKNTVKSRKTEIARVTGLITIDHIPRSSMSHCGLLSCGEPLPVAHAGEPMPRGLRETLDGKTERVSTDSSR